MDKVKVQEVNSEIPENKKTLLDKSATGRVNPWRKKKMGNEILSEAYRSIDYANKANRLQECATFVQFRKVGDRKKLIRADFCRVRLCPMCAWRRSLKVFAHTNAIMNAMPHIKHCAYIFVTLTVRNCRGEDLNDTINAMMKAWDRFVKYAPVKKAVKGFYRGMEVTHNLKRGDLSYNTFHPHFHCVFAVNPSYFKKQDYIKQEDWVSLWQKALKVDYSPVVDVRRVKGDTAKAVAEAAKYTVKESDYLIPNDWSLTTQTVKLLDGVLANRRFVAYGGLMKELHKVLNLDDTENGNLVNVDGDVPESNKDDLTVTFVWYTGYRQYILSE
jgi:plasmid rolling circle replication initiator protein Rep